MSSSEVELHDEVDLTDPSGRALNPAARGWSRSPLHRARLHGSWGRNKRWDYWAVLAGDLVVSFVYADVDYLGIVDAWWVDLQSGESGGRSVIVPGARGLRLPDRCGTEPLRFANSSISLDISDTDEQTLIDASWRESDGSRSEARIEIDRPPSHESLNVVIPWTDRRFQYTSKHQARPARGILTRHGRRIDIGPDAWGVLDVGRGRWPYSTVWNWGGGAGVGHDETQAETIVGLQIGGKWTAGTGFTENGVIVDGTLHKIGRELDWSYDWDDPTAPWTVIDPGGQLHLTLEPRYDKHSRTNLVVLSTETHQMFGNWSGWLVTDDGRRIEFGNLQGFAEESRSRW